MLLPSVPRAEPATRGDRHRTYLLAAISAIAILLGAISCGPKLEGPRKLIELEQYGAASDALQRTIQDYPDCGKCYFLLGVAQANEAISAEIKAEDQERLAGMATRSFDTTIKLDPDNDLARLYSASVQKLASPGETRGRLIQLPERTKNAYPAYAAGLLADKDRIALDALVFKSLAGDNWKAVLKHSTATPQYAIVLSQKVNVDCPQKPGCDVLERGKVLNVTRFTNGKAFFNQRQVQTKQGWMDANAITARNQWHRGSTLRTEYFPIVFEKQPPECPPVGGEWPAYWSWLEGHLPHRLLNPKQSSTVSDSGKRLKTARSNYGGTCKAGQYDSMWSEWALVTYQEESFEERSLPESALAPGCAMQAHEEGRASMYRREWPDDLQTHLLRGELTRGLTSLMALASVGKSVTCKKFTYGISAFKATCSINEVPGLDLDFENDVLLGWNQK